MLREPLTTIQTCYSFEAILGEANLAVAEETAEAGPEDACQASPVQKQAFSTLQGESFALTNATRGGLKAAEGGWLGSRKRVAPEHESSLEELLQRGLELVQWDGVTPHALMDASGFVVAVLAGRATGTFKDVLLEATSEFERVRASRRWRRWNACSPKGSGAGGVPSTPRSPVFPMAGEAPMQTVVPKIYQDAANEARESKAMFRLAGFQNQAFKSFSPKIHEYYEVELSKLYSTSPRLRRPHASSIMPAAAYNLGPATVCRPHRDSANLSSGICVITAVGCFNPKTGGHLVLRELGLVVEFPPGAAVLIPSAVITHHNTKVLEGERRYSFTQYAAGSLLCYIHNGVRPEQEIMSDLMLSPGEKHRHAEARREHWSRGLALFPHISDYRAVP